MIDLSNFLENKDGLQIRNLKEFSSNTVEYDREHDTHDEMQKGLYLYNKGKSYYNQVVNTLILYKIIGKSLNAVKSAYGLTEEYIELIFKDDTVNDLVLLNTDYLFRVICTEKKGYWSTIAKKFAVKVGFESEEK